MTSSGEPPRPTDPGAMPEDGRPVWFGDYLLVDLIAAGGMAHVFRGLAFGVEGFARQVAIKRVLPQWAKDKNFVNMLIDEARIAVALSHPSIVQTYELGEVDGRYYIAMEYVAGTDLRHLLNDVIEQGERLPVPLAAFIVSSVCGALDHAHRRQSMEGSALSIVHRDVSPHNVLLGYNGEVKVTDFGIASAEDRLTQTRAGALKGKFAYMAPEQVRGQPVTRAADIFACGSLLFELVTGRQLFEGDSDFAVLEQVRNAEFTPPRQIDPNIPAEVEAIILRALAANPDDRFAWASDMEEALQPLLIEDRSIVGRGRLATLLQQYYPEASAEESSISNELLEAALRERSGETDDTPSFSEMPTRIAARKKRARTQVLATKSGWETIGADVLAETQETPWLAPTVLSGPKQAQRPEQVEQPKPAVTASSVSGGSGRSTRAVGVIALFAMFAAIGFGVFVWQRVEETGETTNLVTTAAAPEPQQQPETPAPVPQEPAQPEEPVEAETQTGAEPETGAEAEPETEGEPETATSSESPRERLVRLRRTLDKGTRRHGIISGDLPALDSNRSRMNQADKRGDIETAVAAGEKAAAVLRRFSLDKAFLFRKLERFNRRFDKTRDAALREKLSAQASKIGVAISSGELREANRQLNAAFRMLGG